MDISKILNKQIELIKPDANTFGNIKKTAKGFCLDLSRKLKNKKIKADVFIGGSLAKNTLGQKGVYDVDVFVRFDKKYGNDRISKILEGIVGNKAKKVHGSRDYYQISVNGIIIEIVPVLKINNPKQAENITDLSYFHVNYILKRIKKNKRLSDEILLAKTFAHANDCYGAESYIHGFSGYALELIVCHYESFLKFIKEIVKLDNKKKIVIDDKKFYKNKNQILIELNESKLNSPIILIDPTFKQRNALAGLSNETFEKFKKACVGFLKNPSEEYFKKKNIFEELKNKYGNKLKIVSVKTNKQKGDIAGTKSRKFFCMFSRELIREFEIKKSFFDYDEKKNTAYFYFVLDKKKDEIIKGPHITKVENLTAFKKKYKKAFIKNHIACAKIKHELSFKEFFGVFKKKYKKIIKEMCVKEIKLIK